MGRSGRRERIRHVEESVRHIRGRSASHRRIQIACGTFRSVRGRGELFRDGRVGGKEKEARLTRQYPGHLFMILY